MSSIVVHYQEIALKGKNRPWFLARLVRNLRRAVSDLDVRAVRVLMGRIEVELGPGAVREEVGERIRKTFGIANFSYATRTRLDLDVIAADVLRELEGENCSSFRVSARRADKRFPLTSPQIEREIGRLIEKAVTSSSSRSRRRTRDRVTNTAFSFPSRGGGRRQGRFVRATFPESLRPMASSVAV